MTEASQQSGRTGTEAGDGAHDGGRGAGAGANAGKRAKDLNEVIRYTLWSVFRLRDALPEDRSALATEVEELFARLAEEDVVVRGTYDVSGLRADADLMIWWHAESS